MELLVTFYVPPSSTAASAAPHSRLVLPGPSCSLRPGLHLPGRQHNHQAGLCGELAVLLRPY